MSAEPIDFATAKRQKKNRDAASGRKSRRRGGGTTGGPPADDNRPLIKTYGGGLHLHVEEGEKALGEWTRANPFYGVYTQAGVLRLVRPVRLTEASSARGIRLAAGTLVQRELSFDLLGMFLNKAARFEKFDKRAEGWVPIDSPPRVARALADAAPWPQLPMLCGVTTTPTIRPDGSLLDRAGYDATSGWLYVPGAARFPQVPARPTRDQALAALAELEAILDGFPFAGGAARSAAVAAIITAIVRPAMRSAPLFAISAPRPGTGKTLLATLVGLVATGASPALLTQAEKPEEERKRLLSILLDAPRVAVFDNVERPLKSDALCTILSEETWSDRILGGNTAVRVSTAITWCATGNNLVLAGDLAERALEIRLDANCAAPEEREFSVNLHELVPAKRPELVAAALTIIRAWVAAGRPVVRVPQFGRFEAWSELVRKPLVWLGRPDPCETRQLVRHSSPERDRLVGLLLAWWGVHGSKPASVRQAADHSDQNLYTALMNIAASRGVPDARAIGAFLRQRKDRWETMPLPDGDAEPQRLRFVDAGRDRANATLWSVEAQSGEI